MMLLLSIFVMLIDLAVVLILINKIGVLRPASVFGSVVFFYGHAFLIDYLLWPNNIHYPAFNLFHFDVNSTGFLFANLSYMLFLVPFSMLSIHFHKKTSDKMRIKPLNSERFNFLYNIILFLSVVLLYFYLTNTYDLSRTEKNALLTPLLLTMLTTITYFWVWVVFDNQGKGLLFFSFSSLVILFFFYSFEREPILLIFLIFLFLKKNITIKDFYVFLVLLILLTLWKSFFTLVVPGKSSVEYYLSFIKSLKFSFSSLDPLVSFSLLVDYFNNPSVYQSYSFSYITNFYGQLYRMFFPSNYLSLSEYTSMYFVYNSFGLAFSMIIESFLNFSYIGPFFLGIFLSKIIHFFTIRSQKFGNAILVILTMISIKFIRTELMTLLKLQILPAYLSYVLYSFSKKQVRLPSLYKKN